MSNELQVPDYLKGAGTQAATADLDSAALSSMSVPRISLRGRTFRFVENGEEVKKINESVDVIIIGVEPEAGRMIKTFYSKGYSPGASEPPDCASDDGLRPSPWVTNKQAEFCQTCKWNQFGSATSPTGKPTKKCRDAKRLWVMRADDPQLPKGTLYGLNVTVNSLKSFSELGRVLKGHNLPFSAVITKLTMADAEYPQLEFAVTGFVKQEHIETTLKLTQDRPWRLNIEAGRALAAPENTTSNLSLPGQIPPHIAQATQAAQQATGGSAPAAPAGAAKPVDDVLNSW